MQTVFEFMLQAIAVWLLFGAAFAFVEFELGHWAKMDSRTFRRRMVPYGPIFWVFSLFFAYLDWRDQRKLRVAQ